MKFTAHLNRYNDTRLCKRQDRISALRLLEQIRLAARVTQHSSSQVILVIGPLAHITCPAAPPRLPLLWAVAAPPLLAAAATAAPGAVIRRAAILPWLPPLPILLLPSLLPLPPVLLTWPSVLLPLPALRPPPLSAAGGLRDATLPRGGRLPLQPRLLLLQLLHSHRLGWGHVDVCEVTGQADRGYTRRRVGSAGGVGAWGRWVARHARQQHLSW